MKQPRILCSIPNLNGGGAERIMLRLLEHLPAAGLDVSLMVGVRRGQFASMIPQGIEVLEVGSERGHHALAPMRRLFAQGRYDVSFSMTAYNMTAGLAKLGAPSSRTKLVFGARNHYSSALSREATHPWLRKAVVSLLYPRADLVIAVAEDTRRDLIERFGVPAGRVETIHNPVDVEIVRGRAAEPVDDPMFSGGVPVFVNVGKLMEAKGHRDLLEAFKLVLEVRDARLVILGVGPLESALRGQARAAGIEDRVRFAGFQMNPYRYMARATSFVLSSWWEGFPNVLVEAMAAGTAVIATDCPSGPSEIVTHEQSGLLVPVRSPAALASAMLRVADDTELRDHLREGAAREVRRFAVDRIVARYAETLARLALA